MPKSVDSGRDLRVLQNKRDATRYQILVQIAERQPAVSQAEIAEALGITSQAVSEYLKDLVEKQQVDKLGRGRYEITTEGVDWLISQTDDLQEFTRYVSEEVVGQVDIETAIATEAVSEGQQVSLSMQDGILHATPGETGSSTATAITDAEANGDVGVTDFQGLLEFELGRVTIIAVPSIRKGGSKTLESAIIVDQAESHELLAAAGTEALAAVHAAGLDPDLRFGTPEAVQEAALKGLDVLLLAVTDSLSKHTDRLREHEISYEVIEVNE